MTWWLKLYPRAWRQRYGAELADLVASQPRSVQLAIDVLGGAIDAHLKPQAFAQRRDDDGGRHRGGLDMLTRLKDGGTETCTTRKDAFVGAGLTLGAALVVAAIMVIGDNPLAKTIGLTMFPGVLVVGVQPVYLRGHSMPVKIALTVGPFLVLFLIGLLAGLATI